LFICKGKSKCIMALVTVKDKTNKW